MKKKRKIKKIILPIILIILCITLVITPGKKQRIKPEKRYLASSTNEVILYQKSKNETLKKVKTLNRGIRIKTKNKIKTIDNINYIIITYNNNEYYIKEENITNKKENIAKEKTIYTKVSTYILENSKTDKIIGLTEKKDELQVLKYDTIEDEGKVNMYHIKKGNIEGYISGKYISYTKEEASKNYNSEIYDQIHSKVKNTYNGGNAINLDFYPTTKEKFENNKMPESVYALYLNSSTNVIKNINDYIEFAKDTKINAFVVDIKENEMPGYDSEVMKELSPTNYENARNSKESFGNAIKKLKDAGFYVIGRITVFKDKYYAMDNPSAAMTSKATGEPYLYTNTYWPSPYSRDVWYFNVALAKEAITEFGFNEINFDYVRFPDRLQTIERNNLVDFHNTYEEEKAQAIQRFLMYACDEIHALGAYVSVDVFGEATNGYYTTAYGQYWPAISNVVDVISGMPYPDHFAAGNYGIAKPWNEPYKLMNAWAKEAMKRQDETTSPAIVRTWIQAYDTQNYVDPNGLDYNSEAVKAEVEGLFDGGATGGYMTWLSSSNLSKYKAQKEAYSIDYK